MFIFLSDYATQNVYQLAIHLFFRRTADADAILFFPSIVGQTRYNLYGQGGYNWLIPKYNQVKWQFIYLYCQSRALFYYTLRGLK